ncbi:cytochrome P450 [Linnemannia elongata]|nr:cytochrome P450 [Linnemannia elongata]
MAVISTLAKSIQPALILKSFFTVLSTYLLYKTYLYPTFLSPLRRVPGPPTTSKNNKYHIPLLGHFLDLLREEPGKTYRDWIDQYGGIVAYRGLFNAPQIVLGDPKAIQHVFLTHADEYHKPERAIRLLSQVVGKGVLLVEGDVHRKQRKMLNPAFSHKHIKEMVSTMAIPAEMLGRMWEERVDMSEDGCVEFDVARDLGSCTLDIIGRAGFGYDFQALTIPDNELSHAYRQLFVSASPVIQLLRLFVPFYVDIPFKHNRIRKQSARTIDRVTTRIIQEKRAQIVEGKGLGVEGDGKDLMSILMRANEQVGTLDDGKLTDTELKAQIMTFMAAGHETTSATVTWMLHVFSTHPRVQQKVRQELLDHIGLPTTSETNNCPLSYDTLNTLPYLNACVKELLRFIPPVPTTSRVATQDDTILGYDIPKGTQVILSAAALHKLKSVYGDDAEEFKPERWMDPSLFSEEEKESIKFVTSDMTWAYVPFLTGPRNCIGSKFATIETKILLYYLLINLEYAPVPGFKFSKSPRVTMKPYPGMRLIVKRVQHEASVVVEA